MMAGRGPQSWHVPKLLRASNCHPPPWISSTLLSQHQKQRQICVETHLTTCTSNRSSKLDIHTYPDGYRSSGKCVFFGDLHLSTRNTECKGNTTFPFQLIISHTCRYMSCVQKVNPTFNKSTIFPQTFTHSQKEENKSTLYKQCRELSIVPGTRTPCIPPGVEAGWMVMETCPPHLWREPNYDVIKTQ